jgi:hypothetical protein
MCQLTVRYSIVLVQCKYISQGTTVYIDSARNPFVRRDPNISARSPVAVLPLYRMISTDPYGMSTYIPVLEHKLHGDPHADAREDHELCALPRCKQLAEKKTSAVQSHDEPNQVCRHQHHHVTNRACCGDVSKPPLTAIL